MMMLPATTCSPPNFFTPRYCGLLSRPLREEPTPFLCAICPRSAEADVVDLDFREALPVAAFARVVLPAFLLEHHDLFSAPVPDDFARDLGALQRRHARLDVCAVVAEEHVGEL